MISKKIQQKHKFGDSLTMIFNKNDGVDIFFISFVLLFSLIFILTTVYLPYVGFFIAGYVIYLLFLSYQNLYSLNERCGTLTDNFVASVYKKNDIDEIKEMIVRYNSDYFYAYCMKNKDAYCELLEDTMFSFSRDDGHILQDDVTTEYVLEKGTKLKIPSESMFQLDCKESTQIIIKVGNSLKCFSATGSYHKINGRQKSIYKTHIKIKAGTKVSLTEGEYEKMIYFNMFQENDMYPQYIITKRMNGVLIG
uniref:Uncharacterized protein n=1 Tax=viral metagenome TaxID=1070528 RepID=A0A6C0C8G7_9ZZZZ